MGIWDALSIGAAGVGRGYRSGQELERQMAEMKRKALLEERDAQIRERSQATQDALAQSQIGYQGVQSDLGRETLTGTRAGRLRGEQPAFPSGSRASVLGSKYSLPNTQAGVEEQAPLLAALLREACNTEELNARRNDPNIFGGSRRPYLDPTEQAQEDALDRFVQGLKPDPFMASGPMGSELMDRYFKTYETARKKYGAKRINALMFPSDSIRVEHKDFTPPANKP
jgi:hypothetical protein